MSTALLEEQEAIGSTELVDITEIQLVTFYVGEILLGIDIQQVQEINRQLSVTDVPHSTEYVRGVINLRGNVATVIDLGILLGMGCTEIARGSRNLIVHSQGETIGFLVDKISDILTIQSDEISPAPTNINGIQGRFFSGVHTLESEIVVLLNIEEVLSERKSEE